MISVVIPVFNDAGRLRECLAGLARSEPTDFEVIVVDDGSTDSSAEVAQASGARVVPMPFRSGPAAARNAGARAAGGDILVFIDADVRVRPDTIARIAEEFARDPGLDALFGSYDAEPAERNVLSRYKNLLHHFVHQNGARQASTFWSGCGAIRRDVFLAAGGFSPAYERPSIEDIELGARLSSQGRRIELVPTIQATHLKKWTLSSLLRSDVWDRAVPWTELILRTGRVPNDLNLKGRERWSAALALSLTAWCVAAPLAGASLAASTAMAALLVAAIVGLNLRLYAFFSRVESWWFPVIVLPLQILYYHYSVLGAGIGLARHLMRARRAFAFRAALMGLFLFALAARGAYLWSVTRGPLGNSDTPGYEALATTLVSGAFVGPDQVEYPGRPPLDLLRPPGFPAFLALLEISGVESRFDRAVAQSILGALFAPTLAVLVAWRFGRVAGLIAGVFYAADWATLVHTPLVIAETSFTILIGFGILTLSVARGRPGPMLAGALIVGLAALVKPIAQVVLPVLAVWAWLVAPSGRRARTAAIVAFVAALPILAWAARNQLRHGVFTISAVARANLGFLSNHGLAREDGRASVESIRKAGGNVAERFDGVGAASVDVFRRSLGGFLVRLPAATARTLFGTGAKTVEVSRGGRVKPDAPMSFHVRHLPPIVQIGVFWIAVALGFSAMRRRPADLVLFAGVATILMAVALTMGYCRFRVPAVPLLSVVAGVGIARLMRRGSLDSGP